MSKQAVPSEWVSRFLPVAEHGLRLLDVACGGGRHLRLALERGWSVTGIDRDLSGVADLKERGNVALVETDLETDRGLLLGGEQFDAVVVTNYLWRPILADIVAAVAPHGLLIYETFAVGNERLGRPSNPDFLLRPGELIDAVRGRLIPICYEHVRLNDPVRIVTRIVACGPRHRWLLNPPSVSHSLQGPKDD